MQAHSFRVYFTPLFGVLFTFPSRYLFAIGLPGVFSLAGWCRRIQRGFHLPPHTQGTHLESPHARRRLSRAMAELSRSYRSAVISIICALQPLTGLDLAGLGFSAFARHYLRNHFCFLFLRVLRCFSSPGWPMAMPSAWRVVPFGYPWINDCLRLPIAFRSLPRPS